MASGITKLIKNADPEIWRRFRGYCIALGINMGPAICALMQEVLAGKLKLSVNDRNKIVVGHRKGR